jgi:rhamnosyltransferase
MEIECMKLHRTIAIIVSYFPQVELLNRLVSAVLPQVDGVVIVDNGSPEGTSNCTAEVAAESVHWILLGRNLGIAKAQNEGIEWARIHNATHVVLFDQDSVPSPNMVYELLAVHKVLTVQGHRVAAIGPRFLDSESGAESSFARFGVFGQKQLSCSHESIYVEVDVLVSSGSLISMLTLNEVGGMDESLFIDYVDTEWMLRAHAKGYSSFGACQAFMTHALGDNRRRLWFLRWRTIPIHKPFRLYFMFRNAVLLMLRKNANNAWRRCEVINLFRLALMFGFFVAPRFENVRMIALGVVHGFRGMAGEFDHFKKRRI